MKRIMIAGVSSGCGKTTITCAVLRSLLKRNINVTSFKCGPDYIDPMFHRTVLGTLSYNLDSYFMSDDMLKYSLDRNSGDFSVIEGVMGLYDGLNYTSRAAANEISLKTDTPVVLVIDARRMSRSALAILKGFSDFEENNIKGVIFNGMNAHLYDSIKSECEEMGIKPLGYFPYCENAVLESRHLGLVTPAEINDLQSKISILSEQAEKTIDIDGLIEMASDSELRYTAPEFSKIADVRIALAYDTAFSFHYADNLQLLRDLGAEIVPFSPMMDEKLPDNIDGLIISGGYPELYAEVLSNNKTMLESVKQAVENSIPCIAECGGFMYLHSKMADFTGQTYDMAGAINGICTKADHLVHFGYITITADKDNILCGKGDSIRAHEFHYYDSTNNGDGFTASKNGNTWKCINTQNNMFAGFPHIHFYANPEFAKNFIRSCAKE